MLVAADSLIHLLLLRPFVPGSLWIACRDQFDVAQSVNVLLPFKEENNLIKGNRGSEFRRPFGFGLRLHHGVLASDAEATDPCLRGRPRRRAASSGRLFSVSKACSLVLRISGPRRD